MAKAIWKISRPTSKKPSKYSNETQEIEIMGNIYRFRSKAEARYALYLQWLKTNNVIWDWMYEPQTLSWTNRVGNKVQYRPDFAIFERIGVTHSGMLDIRKTYVEVKGYMDTRSKTKINGFRKAFPNEKLVVVDHKWFKVNTPKLQGLVKGWI